MSRKVSKKVAQSKKQSSDISRRVSAPKKRKIAKPSPEALEAQRVEALILDHRENGRKLARSILRRWRVRMPSDEIDSVVDLALCEAARRFSESHGASFMTFFFYHLRGHLVRSVARAAHSNNIFMAFAQNMGMEPDEWHHVSNEVIWAYAPDTKVFGQQEVETPEHRMLRSEREKKCREAVQKLDSLEQEVIYRSFQGEQPLVNIARNLGYSRCHVSRVKKAALERLKNILEENSESSRADSALREKRALQTLLGTTQTGRARRRARRRATLRNVHLKVNSKAA